MSLMLQEIAEQPAALERTIKNERGKISTLAQSLRARDIDLIVLVARGSVSPVLQHRAGQRPMLRLGHRLLEIHQLPFEIAARVVADAQVGYRWTIGIRDRVRGEHLLRRPAAVERLTRGARLFGH